ncbi:MAG: Phospholipid/Glycerol Acyltransferase [Bacteroidetes bacterium]|nr:Phospholipid/Glycerol Acyltransferase [Bacteroidota bacterium]
MLNKFDHIRPYNDSEIPLAISRVVNNKYFPVIIQTLFPDKEIESCKKEILKIKSIKEFQSIFMYPIVDQIIKLSVEDITYSGIKEFLNNNKQNMFISNHRDIVLDSALLNFQLFKNNFDTCEITFGSNLMKGEIVIDIGKMNKMFRIVRGGNIRDFYKNSMQVSSYMRYAITNKKQSVWIAQRNGRTKNGYDKTEMAVLKMFSLSSEKSFTDNLLELNITPVAISYQFEPCAFLKTAELYVSSYQKYVKAPNEDLNSILKGIKQNKGKIHLSVTKPISKEELDYCDSFEKNEKFLVLAQIIDKRIYKNYKLFNTNFIAHDFLNKSYRYQANYTKQEQEEFIDYMQKGLKEIPGEYQELENIFLKIYANPVDIILHNCSL